MEQMNKMIKPAFRHVALFLAERYHLHHIVVDFDNLFTLIMASIQWNMINRSGSSLIEYFYGLVRRRSVSTSTGSIGDRTLTNQQKLLSFAFIIILPNLMESFRNICATIRDDIADDRRSNGYMSGSLGGSSSTATPVFEGVNQPQQDFLASPILGRILSLISKTLTSLSRYCVHGIAEVFPYVEFAGEVSTIAFQLMYACNVTAHHHPVFALLGMSLEKRNLPSTATNLVTAPTTGSGSSVSGHNASISNTGTTTTSSLVNSIMDVNASAPKDNHNHNHSTSNNYLSIPVTIVLALVVCVKVVEYLRNDEQSSDTSLTARISTTPTITAPPPPRPAKVGRGCVVPPNDGTLCALCQQKRTHPCASSSGYVFCYLCLLPYVREHGCCPITGLKCRELDIIRLFENSSNSI